MPEIELKIALEKLISSPNTASRKPVFEKYDKTVQGNTAHERGKTAASVITPFRDFPELDESHAIIGVAAATGGNPNLAKIDAEIVAEYAMAEAALKISCMGGVWLGATDCLNFGNPEKKEQMGELVAGISGIKKACVALEIPIVSGNVSLYNESAGCSVPPSALVSVFGRVESVHQVPSLAFPKGSKPFRLWFLGHFSKSLAGSEFFKIFGKNATDIDPIDFSEFRGLCDFVQSLHAPMVSPIGGGGLWKTLCESAFLSQKGFEIALPTENFINALFGEPLGVVVAVDEEEDLSQKFKSAFCLGTIRDDFSFSILSGTKKVISGDLESYQNLWENRLRAIF